MGQSQSSPPIPGQEHGSALEAELSWALPVRNTYMRSLHYFLLQSIPLDALTEFWGRKVMRMETGVLEGADLVRLADDHNAHTPAGFMVEFLHSLDELFLRCGMDFPKRWSEFVFHRDGHNASAVLFYLKDELANFFSEGSIHRGLLEHGEAEINGPSPSTRLKFFPDPNPDQISGIGYFDWSIPNQFHLPEFGIHLAPVLQGHPARFEAQPFSGMSLHSEATRPEHIWPSPAEIREIPWAEFLATVPEGERIPVLPDENGWMVFVPTSDVFCPIRQRIVLHKGRAYGAPRCVYRLWHDGPKESGTLATCLKEIQEPESTRWHALRPKHLELLERLESVDRFHLRKDDNSIFLGPRRIAAGRGARLLTEILDISQQEKRSAFERKEFATRKEFVSSPENTGFSVTLRRLETALERTNAPVRILIDRRGGFRLEILRPYRFVWGESPSPNRPLRGEYRVREALAPPIALGPSPKLSVLLVDDHRFVREALHRILDRSGEFSRIDSAGTLTGSLKLCGNWSYDAIVLDLCLPDAYGFEALERMTLRFPSQPILVLSAQELPSIRSHGLNLGAVRYQDKTASESEILGAVLETARAGRDREGRTSTALP